MKWKNEINNGPALKEEEREFEGGYKTYTYYIIVEASPQFSYKTKYAQALSEGFKEIKLAQEGKKELKKAEDLLDELGN